jgi:Na+/melibiose symporter-like transporter
MRLPSFAVSVISGSLFRVGVGATPFLLPMMIQIGFGKSPAQSGLITFASAIGAIGMKPATQYFLHRFGFRNLLIFNGILCALGPAAYAAFRPSWPIALIYAVLLVTGFMRSLQFTAYNTIAYADVPSDRMSSATTLYAALQQISLTIAIPISAFVLQLTRAGHARPELSDFSAAFLTIAAIAMLAGPTALLLPSDAGGELAGRD